MLTIHIGNKIKEVLDRSPLTVKDFAGKIFLTRDGANKLFTRKDINAGQLKKISEILDFDFFVFYHPEIKSKNKFATKNEFEDLKRIFEIFIKKVETLIP